MNKLQYVIHVSPTPLVGAPGKYAASLSRYTKYQSVCLVLSDYPGKLSGKFMSNSILWNFKEKSNGRYIDEILAKAEIVHIHNMLPLEVRDHIAKKVKFAKFVYHVHSPIREGPLYVNRAEELDLPFSKYLVVGQIWPRLYPEFTPVPNIIDAAPSINLIEDEEKTRILYCPTHRRPGRWGTKVCEELDDALERISASRDAEVIIPDKPLSPLELLELRRTSHVSIDEINTGGFHQVSLEGMCCGNAVINGADYFSMKIMEAWAQADESIPFVRSYPEDIFDKLKELIRDRILLRDLQIKASSYFDKYLSPNRLINIYEYIYDDIVNAPT